MYLPRNNHGTHSRPGAPRIIYLIVEGHVIAGTEWNRMESVPASFETPRFRKDGIGDTFTEEERRRIIAIWRAVAEVRHLAGDIHYCLQDEPPSIVVTLPSVPDSTLPAVHVTRMHRHSTSMHSLSVRAPNLTPHHHTNKNPRARALITRTTRPGTSTLPPVRNRSIIDRTCIIIRAVCLRGHRDDQRR